MKEYGKERETIVKKYDNKAASYYKRRLCAIAAGKELTELAPPRNAKEMAERTGEGIKQTAKKTGDFFAEQDQKYQVSQKASELASKTKAGIMGLVAKARGTQPENQGGQIWV